MALTTAHNEVAPCVATTAGTPFEGVVAGFAIGVPEDGELEMCAACDRITSGFNGSLLDGMLRLTDITVAGKGPGGGTVAHVVGMESVERLHTHMFAFWGGPVCEVDAAKQRLIAGGLFRLLGDFRVRLAATTAGRMAERYDTLITNGGALPMGPSGQRIQVTHPPAGGVGPWYIALEQLPACARPRCIALVTVYSPSRNIDHGTVDKFAEPRSITRSCVRETVGGPAYNVCCAVVQWTTNRRNGHWILWATDRLPTGAQVAMRVYATVDDAVAAYDWVQGKSADALRQALKLEQP